MQLAVAGCLKQLANICPETDDGEANAAGRLLASPEGQEMLTLAEEFECKLLIAQPTVQEHLTREWRGELLNETLSSFNPWLKAAYLLFYFVVLFFNVLFIMPLVSIWPPLQNRILRLMTAVSPDHGEFMFLLNTPCVKFILAEMIDLVLTSIK